MFSNDYKTVKNRLGYCFDLCNAKDLAKETTAERDLLIIGKRVKTLRSLIAGQSLPKHEILLTSTSALHSFLKDQIESFEAETDEAAKAQKLLKIKNFLDVQAVSANQDKTRMLSVGYDRDQIASKITENSSLITGLVNHTIENSLIKDLFDADRARALNDELKRTTQAYDEQAKAAWKALTSRYDEIRKPFIDFRDEFLDKLSNDDLSLEEREAIKQEYQPKLDALETKSREDYKKLKSSLYDDLEANHKANKQRITDQKLALVKVVKDAILAKSTVTHADAEKWIAEKVTITKAVQNKMKRNGITPEKFHQDLKDFFVITNGRLGKIRIDTKNHDRAYASGTTTHDSEGYVMLDNEFSQRVLWHELAHHLESDDALRLVAREYIKSRSLDGGKRHKLRDLTGNKGFGHREIAYKTDMYSHYVAKIYEHGSTEVFSMGVEAMYDDLVLYETMLKDPKTIEFVAGALMQSKDEIDLINQGIRDGVLEVKEGVSSLQVEKYQEIFLKLAGLVAFNTSFNADESEFLPVDKTTFFDEWKSKFYGTLTLPGGKELVLLKSGKVKYKSFRGRAMKGVFALDFAGYRQAKPSIPDDPRMRYFAYGYGVNDQAVHAIQTQDLDRIKVLALSMEFHKTAGYSIPDTKGEIGEGFMSFEKLDNLSKHYLQG
ncbi:hypothetical protein [Acinetobacter variabilis]|uniref:Uncharacterized protein n=1 Tax=Acinetobacter variabilis TaxID=70346 RepID=N8WTY4_9GAMM|nr:hypothetical protein [Acinetobacter variabilis]ENV00354.1 hypothetical protein F969_00585 [Acinetobacter variabilis]